MRAQFLLLPVAAVSAIAAPAYAKVYLSIEEAQRLMFPGATFAAQPPTAFAKVAMSSRRLPICCPYRSTLTRPMVMRSRCVRTVLR